MTAKLRSLAAGEHAGGGLRCVVCVHGSTTMLVQPGMVPFPRQALPSSPAPASSVPCPVCSMCVLHCCCSERVAAVTTLATFLSYLTFTRPGFIGGPDTAAASSQLLLCGVMPFMIHS